uniref:Uncharacterized protein n=1 Tax=Oryza brachyantha TaxID=4533 RepID=J3LUM3_ORYBR
MVSKSTAVAAPGAEASTTWTATMRSPGAATLMNVHVSSVRLAASACTPTSSVLPSPSPPSIPPATAATAPSWLSSAEHPSSPRVAPPGAPLPPLGAPPGGGRPWPPPPPPSLLAAAASWIPSSLNQSTARSRLPRQAHHHGCYSRRFLPRAPRRCLPLVRSLLLATVAPPLSLSLSRWPCLLVPLLSLSLSYQR